MSTTLPPENHLMRQERGMNTPATQCLALVAAPTFALMALLTGLTERGMSDPLCSVLHSNLPVSSMTWMYMLMSVFHLGPWLKRVARAATRAPS